MCILYQCSIREIGMQYTGLLKQVSKKIDKQLALPDAEVEPSSQ